MVLVAVCTTLSLVVTAMVPIFMVRSKGGTNLKHIGSAIFHDFRYFLGTLEGDENDRGNNLYFRGELLLI